MNFDRFKPDCECSMYHEKPESYPDDYKPQCECNQPNPVETFLAGCKPKHFKTERWYSVGLAVRKENGSVRHYIAIGEPLSSFESANSKITIMGMDYNRRGIFVAKDEFCVIEHTETFYMV